MEQDSKQIDLHTLRRLALEFSEIEGSCYFAHLKLAAALPISAFGIEHVKVEGIAYLFLLKGSLGIRYNVEEYTLTGPVLFSFHSDLISLYEIKPGEDAEFYVVSYSPSFLQEINISFSSISSDVFIGYEEPYFKIKDRDVSVVLHYLTMIQHAMNDKFNLQLCRHIVANLTAAFFYQVMTFLYKTLGNTEVDNNGPRRSGYVQEFIKLVHQYYTQERSVNFYASKLFISPKYLSLLVKEATGRSAARWIDHFVITEAKNLLRYSGKNIQQVAYALNFSNQSSFGKYFKHLTGLSPTEFQKS